MTQDPDPLAAMTRTLSPYCRVTGLPGGALIADWKRTRFLGMATADVERFADEGSGERARLLKGLVRAGCAPPGRPADADADVGRWLRGGHLLIRTLGFGRVLRLLPLVAPQYARTDTPSPADVARLKRAVQTVSRGSWFVNGDCKTEAVTAFVLLRRRGFEAALHVGVRKHPFALHAWTSAAGLSIPDADPRGHAFAPVLTIGC
ncbi:lasso peptide biosynthesis B2 protein [Streptomyces spinosus]|uniref:lasso peptide biosynthesis B2 protein n=1 Tax=Streptomyces spinosus TaxID=2872623 RepID=UPI001CECD200|nr:lasso peptide biosynthesis B2 protein [Streptomyces spinosus]